MELDSRIFVAGHNGLVGSAIVRKLKSLGYKNIIVKDRSEIDLRDKSHVNWLLSSYLPEYVFLAAAKVGGISYNKANPADFIYENLEIQNNVIHGSYKHGVKKLLFLGSACIYPRITPQPIKEEYLLTGYLEPTNEAYAVAKIAGLKMCAAYKEQYGFDAISLMPTNLYGINDNFDINQCHVIPSMINKFVNAKRDGLEEVVLFGDGTPTREFLYADDLADACVFLMNNYSDSEHINVGSSEEYTISELANTISNLVGYEGKIVWDTSRPNGTPKRKLDNSRIESLGWKSSTTLTEGLTKTIDWYINTGGFRHE
jgi:GDP-L-fucose synthase